jgi:hypothetical protein
MISTKCVIFAKKNNGLWVFLIFVWAFAMAKTYSACDFLWELAMARRRRKEKFIGDDSWELIMAIIEACLWAFISFGDGYKKRRKGCMSFCCEFWLWLE